MSGPLNRCLQPEVSVVIPALNEEGELGECLASLARQDFPAFEVIVVDNGSTDRTSFIAEEWGARVVLEKRRGPGYARDAGFREAKAPIIASTDADTVLPPYWISRIHRAFQDDKNVIAVFGPIRAKPRSAPSALSQAFLPLIETTVFFGQKLAVCAKAPLLFGANFAVRREAFFVVGGFRSPRTGQIYVSSEDILFGLKLRQLGKVLYLPDLVVWTSARRVQGPWVVKAMGVWPRLLWTGLFRERL